MSIALERVVNQENQGNEIKHYKSYFYRALKTARQKFFTQNIDLNVADIAPLIKEDEYTNHYQEALQSFLSKKTEDENCKFYQNIIRIYLEYPNERDLSSRLGMDRGTLRKRLKEAHKLIKHEYNTIVAS